MDASSLQVRLIEVLSRPHHTKAESLSRQFGLGVCHLLRFESVDTTQQVAVVIYYNYHVSLDGYKTSVKSKTTLYHLGNPIGYTINKRLGRVASGFFKFESSVRTVRHSAIDT